MSSPHYCLSISCRHVKGPRAGATHWSAFHTFVLLQFIYQVSLPDTSWYLKIEGLCECLTVSVTGSHHVPLLELLLRLNNGNLGNLMLRMSELFPRGKLNHFHMDGWEKNSNTGTNTKKVLWIQICLKRHLPVCACASCRVRFLHLCTVLSGLLSLNRKTKQEKLNYHLMSLRTKLPRYKLKIGYRLLCCCYNLVLAVFNVSVQIVLSLKVMGGKKEDF